MSEEKKNAKLNEKETNEKRTNDVKSKEDVKTQYCDGGNCQHDCMHGGKNNCDAIILGFE